MSAQNFYEYIYRLQEEALAHNDGIKRARFRNKIGAIL